MTNFSVASRFKALDSKRQGVLDRNRECARLTLPHLLTESGHNEDDSLPQPYQSEGAAGLNNIAAKMQLSLFPPQTSFFALNIPEKTLQEFQSQSPEARQQVEDALQDDERIILEDIEANAMRPVFFNNLRHTIGLGTGCLFIPDEGKAKAFNLDQYVVLRDDKGEVVELIIKETFDPITLPKAHQAAAQSSDAINEGEDKTQSVDVYTYVKREEKLYKAAQHIGEVEVPGTASSYPVDASPWIVPRWTEICGENYGRGLIEENFGDLNALEHLSMALTLSIGIGAKTIFLCDPNGVTDPKKLSNAAIGEFVAGREGDVTTIKVDKVQDLQAALSAIDGLKRDLRRVFLRNYAVQRDGERVTAEEIRLMADELETAHGGAYSRLAEELQRPVLNRLMARNKSKLKLGKMKGLVKPHITTGLEAIGRGQDLMKLERGLSTLGNFPGAIEMHNIQNLATRVWQALGVDHKGLLKTAEEIQAEQQQAQAQALMEKAAAPVAGALANGAVQANTTPTQG